MADADAVKSVSRLVMASMLQETLRVSICKWRPDLFGHLP